jgi:hypothetical protein
MQATNAPQKESVKDEMLAPETQLRKELFLDQKLK